MELAPQFRLGGQYAGVLVDEVKNPLKQALADLATGKPGISTLVKGLRVMRGLGRIPEPTRENTSDPNTLLLIDIRDEFLERCKLSAYQPVYRMLWKLALVTYCFDEPYRQFAGWVISRLKESEFRRELPDVAIWVQDWEKEKSG